jgi:hypothetical protein
MTPFALLSRFGAAIRLPKREATDMAPPAEPSPLFAENVRLVVWDLDDTFWHGTLTEGGIHI